MQFLSNLIKFFLAKSDKQNSAECRERKKEAFDFIDEISNDKDELLRVLKNIHNSEHLPGGIVEVLNETPLNEVDYLITEIKQKTEKALKVCEQKETETTFPDKFKKYLENLEKDKKLDLENPDSDFKDKDILKVFMPLEVEVQLKKKKDGDSGEIETDPKPTKLEKIIFNRNELPDDIRWKKGDTKGRNKFLIQGVVGAGKTSLIRSFVKKNIRKDDKGNIGKYLKEGRIPVVLKASEFIGKSKDNKEFLKIKEKADLLKIDELSCFESIDLSGKQIDFFIDGVDEISAAERQQLFATINGEVGKNSDLTFILTSRYVDETKEGEDSVKDFQKVKLNTLDKEHRTEFVKNYLEGVDLKEGRGDAGDYVPILIEWLQNPDTTVGNLLETPGMLVNLCMIFKGYLKETQDKEKIQEKLNNLTLASIYQETVKYILDVKEQSEGRDNQRFPLLGESKKNKEWKEIGGYRYVFSYVAYELLKQGLIAQREFSGDVLDLAIAKCGEGIDKKMLKDQMLESNIIRKNEENDTYEFIHLSYQSYFCAEYLNSKQKPVTQFGDIIKNYPDEEKEKFKYTEGELEIFKYRESNPKAFYDDAFQEVLKFYVTIPGNEVDLERFVERVGFLEEVNLEEFGEGGNMFDDPELSGFVSALSLSAVCDCDDTRIKEILRKYIFDSSISKYVKEKFYSVFFSKKYVNWWYDLIIYACENDDEKVAYSLMDCLEKQCEIFEIEFLLDLLNKLQKFEDKIIYRFQIGTENIIEDLSKGKCALKLKKYLGRYEYIDSIIYDNVLRTDKILARNVLRKILKTDSSFFNESAKNLAIVFDLVGSEMWSDVQAFLRGNKPIELKYALLKAGITSNLLEILPEIRFFLEETKDEDYKYKLLYDAMILEGDYVLEDVKNLLEELENEEYTYGLLRQGIQYIGNNIWEDVQKFLEETKDEDYKYNLLMDGVQYMGITIWEDVQYFLRNSESEKDKYNLLKYGLRFIGIDVWQDAQNFWQENTNEKYEYSLLNYGLENIGIDIWQDAQNYLNEANDENDKYNLLRYGLRFIGIGIWPYIQIFLKETNDEYNKFTLLKKGLEDIGIDIWSDVHQFIEETKDDDYKYKLLIAGIKHIEEDVLEDIQKFLKESNDHSKKMTLLLGCIGSIGIDIWPDVLIFLSKTNDEYIRFRLLEYGIKFIGGEIWSDVNSYIKHSHNEAANLALLNFGKMYIGLSSEEFQRRLLDSFKAFDLNSSLFGREDEMNFWLSKNNFNITKESFLWNLDSKDTFEDKYVFYRETISVLNFIDSNNKILSTEVTIRAQNFKDYLTNEFENTAEFWAMKWETEGEIEEVKKPENFYEYFEVVDVADYPQYLPNALALATDIFGFDSNNDFFEDMTIEKIDVNTALLSVVKVKGTDAVVSFFYGWNHYDQEQKENCCYGYMLGNQLGLGVGRNFLDDLLEHNFYKLNATRMMGAVNPFGSETLAWLGENTGYCKKIIHRYEEWTDKIPYYGGMPVDRLIIEFDKNMKDKKKKYNPTKDKDVIELLENPGLEKHLQKMDEDDSLVIKFPNIKLKFDKLSKEELEEMGIPKLSSLFRQNCDLLFERGYTLIDGYEIDDETKGLVFSKKY